MEVARRAVPHLCLVSHVLLLTHGSVCPTTPVLGRGVFYYEAGAADKYDLVLERAIEKAAAAAAAASAEDLGSREETSNGDLSAGGGLLGGDGSSSSSVGRGSTWSATPSPSLHAPPSSSFTPIPSGGDLGVTASSSFTNAPPGAAAAAPSERLIGMGSTSSPWPAAGFPPQRGSVPMGMGHHGHVHLAPGLN